MADRKAQGHARGQHADRRSGSALNGAQMDLSGVQDDKRTLRRSLRAVLAIAKDGPTALRRRTRKVDDYYANRAPSRHLQTSKTVGDAHKPVDAYRNKKVFDFV
jgi:hypothetical protein